jgi:hypothetical protein
MTVKFAKATKTQAKLRLAIAGPAGSGKTYSALAIGTKLGEKVALIDTEHGSASKYADKFDFDTLALTTFSPERYVEAIKSAATEGYGVIIIDSLSHAWAGEGGALEIHDAATAKTGNSYTAWRQVTPLHNQLVEAMLQSPAHVIATLRSKTAYSQEKDQGGKTVVRKVGLQPVQRDGMEYEFDVFLDMDAQNTGSVSKTRCPELTGRIFHKPGDELAAILKAWLSDGTVSVQHSANEQVSQGAVSVVASEPKPSVSCGACGKPITEGTDGNGRPFSAERISEQATKLYGQPLCYGCFRRKKGENGSRAAATSANGTGS